MCAKTLNAQLSTKLILNLPVYFDKQISMELVAYIYGLGLRFRAKGSRFRPKGLGLRFWGWFG